MGFDSVGRLLRDAREQRGWSLEETARQAGITVRAITDLEEGGCEVETDIYRREFLHRYTISLGLPFAPLWESFRQERRWCNLQQQFKFNRSLEKPWAWWGPLKWRTLAAAFVFTIMVGYLSFSLTSVFAAPLLEVTNPSGDITTVQREIVVRGRVSLESDLILNGATLVPQEDGTFNIPVTLNEGLNTITIDAVRNNYRNTTIVRHVLVESSLDIRD